jgi:NADH dehydrogenase FAD-containing subunit
MCAITVLSPLTYELIHLQNKRVTIVHGEELLLNEAYPDSFRKTVARSIRKRDVNVILDDRVDDMTISDAGIVTTRNGRKLVADLVVRLYPSHSKLMQF